MSYVYHNPSGKAFGEQFPKCEMLNELTPINIAVKGVKKPVKLYIHEKDDGIVQIRWYPSLTTPLNENQISTMYRMLHNLIVETGFTYHYRLREPRSFMNCFFNLAIKEPAYLGYIFSNPAPSDLLDGVILAEQVALC